MSPHVTPVFERACSLLRELSGGPPAVAACAPGRVNLIGEHTDYSGGFVLPVAIDRACVAVARRGAPDRSGLSRVLSADSPGVIEFDAASKLEPINSERGTPAAYVKGVLRQFQDFGAVFGAMDIAIASSVPLGAGLSSSASLEVAVATLAQSISGIEVTPTQKASMCRRAEHEFAGVPCGIMDQYISAMGREDHALLIDCRTEEARLVAMPGPDRAVLVVANTNVRHSLASGQYALRRAWCESAARKLGLVSLRDAQDHGGMTFVERERTRLEGDEYRAARHVVGENQRTILGTAALERGDLALFGNLMNQSHESLKTDYRVSCPELDCVVEAARGVPGVFGARMTGGGFGGCAIVLAEPSSTPLLRGTLCAEYRRHFGRDCDIFVTRASEGARMITLGALRSERP